MYNLNKNNYHLNPKNSQIYTPPELSNFLFNLLKDQFKDWEIFDPCSGQGSLLAPWKQAGYRVWSNDIDPNSTADVIVDFLTLEIENEWYGENKLVLCNPPFNGAKPQLAPELWLDKILELFGKDVPIVLFAPMGFRLNGKINGKRWAKFMGNQYPAISSIISLPRDIFPGIEFHSEILIFNLPSLEPHYFYQPNYE